MSKDILNNPFKKNFFAAFIILGCFFGIYYIEKYIRRSNTSLPPQETTIHFNEHLVKALSFGQYRFISSVLWAETMLRADTEHYKEGDLNNWIYRRLQLITTLDPYFYQAYLYGGIYLSIIKDDDKGAKHIYDKAFNYYPKDLYLCLNAGYHYHFELNDLPMAINIYKRILDHPNVPRHIPNLLARLQSEEGNLKDAFLTLQTVYQTLPEESRVKERFEAQLYAIKAEIDLNCLNDSENLKKDCSRVDLKGQSYLYNKGSWFAQSPWKPYRIKKKGPK